VVGVNTLQSIGQIQATDLRNGTTSKIETNSPICWQKA